MHKVKKMEKAMLKKPAKLCYNRQTFMWCSICNQALKQNAKKSVENVMPHQAYDSYYLVIYIYIYNKASDYGLRLFKSPTYQVSLTALNQMPTKSTNNWILSLTLLY